MLSDLPSLDSNQLATLDTTLPVIPSSSLGSIRSLTPDLWILLGTYLPTLADFIRVWIVLRLYRDDLPKSHPSFWSNLIQQFLLVRGRTLEDVSHVAHLTAYYKNAGGTTNKREPDPQLDPHDSFFLVRILFQKSKCNRSGCYEFYREIDNTMTSCSYHPGKYIHRRYMSCCRVTSFKFKGCKTGYHDGTFYFMLNLQRVPDQS